MASNRCKPAGLKPRPSKPDVLPAQQYIRGDGGKLYVRMFPHRSITSTPLETRMGKGKGEPEAWVATVKPGTILYELEEKSGTTGSSLLRPSSS